MKTTEKTCFKCGVTKPFSEFYAHKAMADGHLNKCKACAKLDVFKHRHGKGRDRVLAYDRQRSMQPNRVEARKAYQRTSAFAESHKASVKRWAEKYPGREKAHIIFRNAVRDGKVHPQLCWVCGEKGEGHHPDYSRPLDVVWLCTTHHKKTHAMFSKLIEQQEKRATP